MNRTTKIFLFYTGVALISVAIILVALAARNSMPSKGREGELAIDMGREEAADYGPINKDLVGVNQENQPVKLSDLRGKVWVVAEFYAVCPFCAVRNGSELRAIYDEFKSNPDFHLVCITIDPEADNPQRMADYAKALGADTKNWWFVNGGDAKTVHDFMEKEMGYIRVGERKDPLEIEAKGRYEHDLSLMLVDRNFTRLKKWPLTDLGSEQGRKDYPGGYEQAKQELFARIRAELDRK